MKKFMVRGFQTDSIRKVFELVENAGGKIENITFWVDNKEFNNVADAEKYANGKQIAITF